MVRLIMAKKRIRIKAGDIFEVIRCDGNKQYLQFLVVDRSMLDGDVIRVFKKHYAPEAVPSPEDIISDKVLFYAQTSVRRGVREEWWTKYGHSDELGELKRIFLVLRALFGIYGVSINVLGFFLGFLRIFLTQARYSHHSLL